MSQPLAPILIICHTFPRAPGIGGRRWAKFAKALARRGHAVHVIAAEGPPGAEPSPWTVDVDHPGITVHRLPRRYPQVLKRGPLKHLWEKAAYRFWLRVLPLFCTGNHFDIAIFWRKQLLRKAGDLIQRHGIRHVVATGAPFRLLVYGLDLKQRHGIELTCDLRDPWTWHMEYGHSALKARRMAQEKALERRVIEGADHVTSPHPSVIAHLTDTYPAHTAKYFHLPHAIDPDELGTPEPQDRGEHTRLIYAGTLYGAVEAGHYFEHLCQALGRLRQQHPDVYARTTLDLYITSKGTEVHRAQVARAGHAGRIAFHDPLPAREVQQRIARADAVLTFIPSYNSDLLGTKFNETFYLRRPVIHVGGPGAVSRHILRHRLGTSMAVEELPDRLPGIISGTTPLEMDLEYDLSEHLLDRVTDRLAVEILGV